MFPYKNTSHSITSPYICIRNKNENKMKTKSLFLTALVLMSAVAFAGKDDPRNTGMAVVPVKGSEIFKLVYKGQSAGKVKLNIYDSQSQRILSHNFNGLDGFICPLNFTSMKPGEYTIEVVDAAGKQVEKVVYTKANKLKYVHISKINNADGKYLLSVSNKSAGAINVKIFDAKKNLIFTETKDINGDFAQVYKLSNLSDAYTFEVSDDTGNVKTVQF